MIEQLSHLSYLPCEVFGAYQATRRQQIIGGSSLTPQTQEPDFVPGPHLDSCGPDHSLNWHQKEEQEKPIHT